MYSRRLGLTPSFASVDMNSLTSKTKSLLENQFIPAQTVRGASAVQSRGMKFDQVKELFQAMGLLEDKQAIETQYLMIITGRNVSNSQALLDLGSLNTNHQKTSVVVLTFDEKTEVLEACKYVGTSFTSRPATYSTLEKAHPSDYLSPGDLEKNRFKQEPVRWNGKPTHKLEQLTAKQNSVLAELAQGYSNKEIARSLNLSDETVRTHLAGIFRRLGVRNRTQATKRYLLDAQAHT